MTPDLGPGCGEEGGGGKLRQSKRGCVSSTKRRQEGREAKIRKILWTSYVNVPMTG